MINCSFRRCSICDVITELLRGRDNLTDLEQNKRTLLFNTLGLPFTYFHGAFYTACFEVADDGFGKRIFQVVLITN